MGADRHPDRRRRVENDRIQCNGQRFLRRSDATLGRLYLPREALLHAGITSDDPQKVITERALPKVCQPLAERAKAYFEKADEIMKRNSRRRVRAPRIMSKYYRAILDQLLARGFAAPREPVRVNKWAKIAILLRYSII